MRQALYRNYRPRSFDELVGQEHVTTTLKRALKSGRISHAYLFTGPRGVGKTSAARILAHDINGFNYTVENTQLDIIEIDAASNRRIDEIRDLREKVAIAPAAGKYKVYIIDEVHMLTREAFNALLKTLEEPPAHAVFILATTEAHKLPETIVSRTQRFEFKPVPSMQAAKHLSTIAKKEKIDITPDALNLLAEFGGGSFRDSISFLDQLSAAGSSITEVDVRHLLGIPSDSTITAILDQVIKGNLAGLLDSIQLLKDRGVDASAAAAAISRQIRQRIITQNNGAFIMLLKQLIDVPASSRPYDYLELCLLEAASSTLTTNKPDLAKEPTKQMPAAIESRKIKEVNYSADVQLDNAVWEKIVSSAKQRAASIYTALKLAEPEFTPDTLVLKFEFPLHQKKLQQTKNKDIVADLIESLTGQKLKIDCVVDKKAFPSKKAPPKAAVGPKPEPVDHLRSITNIFGTAEAIEA